MKEFRVGNQQILPKDLKHSTITKNIKKFKIDTVGHSLLFAIFLNINFCHRENTKIIQLAEI